MPASPLKYPMHCAHCGERFGVRDRREKRELVSESVTIKLTWHEHCAMDDNAWRGPILLAARDIADRDITRVTASQAWWDAYRARKAEERAEQEALGW